MASVARRARVMPAISVSREPIGQPARRRSAATAAADPAAARSKSRTRRSRSSSRSLSNASSSDRRRRPPVRSASPNRAPKTVMLVTHSESGALTVEPRSAARASCTHRPRLVEFRTHEDHASGNVSSTCRCADSSCTASSPGNSSPTAAAMTRHRLGRIDLEEPGKLGPLGADRLRDSDREMQGFLEIAAHVHRRLVANAEQRIV